MTRAALAEYWAWLLVGAAFGVMFFAVVSAGTGR
jgi:hypothetical protein